MRKFIAAFVAVSLAVLLTSSAAVAAPTTVQVRIEGRAETLFEGPLATEPHGVLASSDTATEPRPCDGINPNDPGNVSPAVTPTAASADAMALLGESFDGQWYEGLLDDYFLTRWGPDEQDPASGAYWGVLVNNTFTAVGGCQYPLADGDEVLWVYDAFQSRPTLALFPAAAAYSSGPRPLTVTGVAPGEAVPVEVVSYADDSEDNPPAAPTRDGSSGYEDATVAPVQTGAKGFERVETSSPEAVLSGAEGKATVEFTEPGWHRIKATVGSPGAESTIRSNRLDICVSGGGGAPLEGASECDELPAADQVRGITETEAEGEGGDQGEHQEGALLATGTAGGGAQPTPAPAPESLRVSRPKLSRGLLAKGRLGVSWKVQSAGPGIRRWTISSLTLGKKGARYVTRASGAAKTRATLHLPEGHSYRLRFAITDLSGHTSTLPLGKVRVPAGRQRTRR